MTQNVLSDFIRQWHHKVPDYVEIPERPILSIYQEAFTVCFFHMFAHQVFVPNYHEMISFVQILLLLSVEIIYFSIVYIFRTVTHFEWSNNFGNYPSTISRVVRRIESAVAQPGARSSLTQITGCCSFSKHTTPPIDVCRFVLTVLLLTIAPLLTSTVQ